MRNKLLNLYIRHSTPFKSLSSIALSQLILKILFLNKTPISFSAVKAELLSVVNGNIRSGDIHRCIKSLIKEEKIILNEKLYSLSTICTFDLEKQEKSYKDLFENVVNFWFKKAESKIEYISDWFENCLIRFFEEFHYEWINELKREKNVRENRTFNLENILNESFNSNNGILENDKKWLKKQFFDFLDSTKPEDNKLLWIYGTTRFSAKLIEARLFTDSVSAEMFCNSTFIIDTNVLMILGLEGYELANSLKTLEGFFRKLNIKLNFLNISKKEYTGANDYLRVTLKNIFKSYNHKVLERLSHHPHVSTILKRNCQEEEDIERFFSQINNIPEFFYDNHKIKILEDAEIDEICEKAYRDQQLKDTLDEINFKIKRKKKNPNALLHDAAIIKVVEHFRTKEKFWILTKDTTIIKYAIDNNHRNEEPIAVSLLVLLNLITYSNYNLDSEEFAPLYATLVKLSLTPEENIFTLEDLQYILDTHLEITKLPDDEVVSIASDLNIARMKGCSDEEASLLLQRRFQKEKFILNSSLEQTKKDLILEKQEKEKAQTGNKLFIENYKKRRIPELRDKYDTKILFSRILFFTFIPVSMYLGFSFVLKNLLSDDPTLVVIANVILSLLITFLGSNFILKAKIIKRYSNYITDIEKTVDEEIKALQGE